jgi:DNA-binding response OmpR family regulator
MNSKNTSQAVEPPDTTFRNESNLPPRILVVDDDEDIRRLNTEALAASGYQVDAAADGADAWEVFQLNRYDLLVTDHNMPKVTGVELLLKIHAVGIVLPVIMVSGTIPTEQLKRHPWLQIDATLLKPYTADELLVTVKKVFSTAGALSPAPRRCVADSAP